MEREMAKKVKETIDASVIDIGIAQEKMASELAVLIDGDIATVVSDLAEHKREYQGGPFVVMDRVLRYLVSKDYDLSQLPDPHAKTGITLPTTR